MWKATFSRAKSLKASGGYTVALDESVILHRFTQNSRNTVLPDVMFRDEVVHVLLIA